MKFLKSFCFWLLSVTWGLPMTLLGALMAVVLLISGHKPHLYGHSVYFVLRKSGGYGFSSGGFFFVTKDCSNDLSIKQHEMGHGFQNIMFGFFMPFVVAIPSVVRFWYRDYLVRSGKKKYSDLPPYDSIWFENQATELGKKLG